MPDYFKNKFVKKYYDYIILKKKSLILKRIFDILASLILIIILLFPMIIISFAIKINSKGRILYKQKRVTQYGKEFFILKFRTMHENSDKSGFLTCNNDKRITKIGKILRKFRLDEFPQLINILLGDMTFVGTRPEVPKYVKKYTDEMLATLILPAGVTSISSINFRNESEYLENSSDPDKIYLEKILPEKMKYNLEYLHNFSFFLDIKIMFLTVLKVFKILR
ncbi:MAG: sugar transferase [Clostridia bacterium]|nr:sugar transferase [Clostridia bacterium]